MPKLTKKPARRRARRAASHSKTISFDVERETDGRLLVEIPELPGAMAYGTTLHAALERAFKAGKPLLIERLQGVPPKASKRKTAQQLRRELRAARAALRAAEARTTCDDLRYLLGEIHTRAAAATGIILQPNSSALAAVEDLARRVAATNAWTKLAHERLTALLGGDNATYPPATLGGVLGLIERLGADRVAANALIARLAFNLSEGAAQEQIEAASPAEQRAVVEAKAFELAELSLLREMARSAQVVMKDDATEASIGDEHRMAYNLLARIAAFHGNGTIEDLEAMPAADLRVIVEASVFEDSLLAQHAAAEDAAEDAAKTLEAAAAADLAAGKPETEPEPAT